MFANKGKSMQTVGPRENKVKAIAEDSVMAKKIALLVETEDEILRAFPPLERCIIVTLKRMAQTKKSGYATKLVVE